MMVHSRESLVTHTSCAMAKRGSGMEWVRAPTTSVGMSWISVPPIATFSTCMPRQMASIGTFGLDGGLGQGDFEGVAAVLGRW